MNYLKIKDWDEHQSYRKDRGTPPWIKVHRSLMSNPKWAMLSDSEKGQIVSIWIIAADNDGRFPDDANMLRKMCQLDTAPDLQKFKDLGLMEADGCQHDAKVTPPRQQHDVPETETETETERKRRAQAHAPEPPPEIPDWIDPVQWDEFMAVRKSSKAVNTNRAKTLLIKKLDKLRKRGHDPTTVIDQSIRNSWKDVWEIKDKMEIKQERSRERAYT